MYGGFDEGKIRRDPGGKFEDKGGGGGLASGIARTRAAALLVLLQAAKAAKKRAGGKKAPARKRAGQAPAKLAGVMSYDPKTGRGTGYGSANGDSRVKDLQKHLNRLGLRDGAGRELKVDGKLGPRTTAAVKAAQRRLGVTPDGRVTPELLRKIAAQKLAPAPKARTPTAPRAVPHQTSTSKPRPGGNKRYLSPGQKRALVAGVGAASQRVSRALSRFGMGGRSAPPRRSAYLRPPDRGPSQWDLT